MDEATELLQFLDLKARLDLKAVALTHILCKYLIFSVIFTGNRLYLH